MSSRLSRYQQLLRQEETSGRQAAEKIQRERRGQRESLKRRIDDVTKQVSSMSARKEKLRTQLMTIEQQIQGLDKEIGDAEMYIDDLTRRLRNYINSNGPGNNRPSSSNRRV